MKICHRCGEKFDWQETVNQFDIEYGCSGFSYDGFRRTICFDCAQEVFDDGETGEYFETCERCGKRFDYFEELMHWRDYVNGTDLNDHWDEEILCAECASDDLD